MRRIVRLCIGFSGAIVLILFSTVVASLALIVTWFPGNALFPADCGLVFGAAIVGTASPGPAIVRRVDGAAALWNEGKVRMLILSGGKGDDWRTSEAAVMRQQAIRLGVPGTSIVIEDGARSTKENLERSKQLLAEHCETVVAISDQYHLARIRLLAKKGGLPDLRMFGVAERPEPRKEWQSVLRELAGYLYYALGADAFLTLDEYDDPNTP